MAKIDDSVKKKVPELRFPGFTDDWEERKLKDIAQFNPKTVLPDEFEYVDLESVVGTEMISHRTESKDQAPSRAQRLAQKGDVFYQTVRPYQMNNYLYDLPYDNYVFSTGYAQMRPNIDSYFLLNSVQNKQFVQHVLDRSTGTSYPAINSSDLSNIEIHVPSKLSEQQKIGAFFQSIDDTITLHQRKLEKSKALKSAYLSEMFPAEGERKPKRRFAGFIDDWKQGTVGEYGYFYYGKSAPKWSVTKDASIPCVRYGELYTKFGAKIDKVYSYTNISKENLKFSTGNEVLVPRVGEDPLDFANCSWLSIPNVAIGEMISVYNTEENPLFISYYFNSQLRHAFAKRVEGGNVSNLYFTYLENITISIPNKEEQDTIANFLESLDSVVEHHQHKLEKLKNIKQAYLNELFV